MTATALGLVLCVELVVGQMPSPAEPKPVGGPGLEVPHIDVLKSFLSAQAGVDPQDKDAVARLVRALRSPDRDKRRSAIAALGEFAAAAETTVPLLTKQFEDGRDPELAEEAAKALGKLSSETNQVLRFLLAKLKSSDVPTRSRVALGLGLVRHSQDTVVPVLLAALRDREPSVQVAAAQAIQHLRERAEPALPELKRRLAVASGLLRVELATAIARVQRLPPPPEVIPALVQALKEKDVEVRRRAAFALANFALVHACRRKPAVEALAEYKPLDFAPGVDALAETLADPRRSVRLAALDALWQMDHHNTERSVKALQEALKDPDTDVRASAAGALGKSGPLAKRAAPALTAAARGDRAGRVRLHAALALWEIGDHPTEWVAVMIDLLLKHPDAEVRWRSALALELVGKADDRVVPALKQALQDEDEDVRRWAKSTLELLELLH
jgi:HEAT repeat protein